jgi:hypothetical protein
MLAKMRQCPLAFGYSILEAPLPLAAIYETHDEPTNDRI